VSGVSAAAGSAQAPGPGLTLGGGSDRAVPAHARELAAQLSALFERDVEIVKRLGDAQRRLASANERLYSGLAPDAFGLLYDDAAAAAIGTSTASDFQLELYVDGYEFPQFDTGRDANTLACEIELDLRRRLDLRAAHSPLILDTLEPASFVDQLRALEHAQEGEATLGDPDKESGDQFGLTIRLKEGNGTLDGFLTDSTTARLSFEMIDIDQEFLHDALAQFAAIVQAFPVRGDITAD
jgi:hypothetical protein